MMKGRADDRRLFERGVKLNVMALVDSAGFDAEGLAKGVELSDYGLKPGDLTELKRLFEHATTFGSLIQVPEGLAAKLPALKQLSEATSQDLFVSEALKRLGPLVQQAELLAAQYDAVVANPPYMGGGGMNALVKKFAKNDYPAAKSDLFACFIDRCSTLSKDAGRVGVVAPYVWMFISSYERLRSKILDETSLTSLIQLEYNAFEPACIPVATFTFMRHHVRSVVGSYIKLSDFKGHQNQAPRTLEAINDPSCGWIYRSKPDDFKKIPGSPIAYWVSESVRDIFENEPAMGDKVDSKVGLQTSDNNRFLRRWPEVSIRSTGFGLRSSEEAQLSNLRWFPCNKGGTFRRWYGNHDFVVNWMENGKEIKEYVTNRYPYLKGNIDYVIKDRGKFFNESVSWSDVTSSINAFRYYPAGFIYDATGHSAFCESSHDQSLVIAFCNNKFCSEVAQVLNPTMHFHIGYFDQLPWPERLSASEVEPIVDQLIKSSRADWNAYERSWDFQSLPILTASSEPMPTLESSYTAWISQNRDTIAEMKRLEEENNRLFIDAYGLADELTPDVPIEQITLTVNPAYRYGGKLAEEEQWTRFRQDTMEELVSYAIGCMMGRYSLDAPGLIYAHSGNEGFDALLSAGQYTTFPADDDGIVPLTDTEWFEDDACNRVVEFMSVAFPSDANKNHLQANLDFLADNLSPKRGESSRETIRRYLCDNFYKDHTQTYKKRPIYWLVSSGKQKAFQCLVYLHRYNEGTLARMRTEYVIPLTSKLSSHVDKLEQDKDASGATAEIKRLQKQIDTLHKQQAELSSFDEKLRHYADHRIRLDLDDGVKENYGKFGDLLAEVKAIHGKNPETRG